MYSEDTFGRLRPDVIVCMKKEIGVLVEYVTGMMVYHIMGEDTEKCSEKGRL